MEKGSGQRKIIHLDMDAFYGSVEALDNPDLVGQPVIVGGVSDRGVVSAASYEARAFGVHSAQPIVTARRLCPRGIFLPVRMGRYKQVSDRIFEIFGRFTPLVEPLSLDEAFLDVTGSTRLFGPPIQIARDIKGLVKREIGLTVSAGVAPTKFLAKIASDLEKPDGLTVVPPDKVLEFLHPLPIGRLWGVGRTTRRTLSLLGVETVGDLARIPMEVLEKKLGAGGRHLHRLAHGLDERIVSTDRETKSVGAEQTFGRDIINLEQAHRELLALAGRVARRTRRFGLQGRTVTLKVKYNDFKQITRSTTLAHPTDESKDLYQAACQLLTATQAGQRPVRLLGISLSRLFDVGQERQYCLFDEPEARRKGRHLDRALDKIADRFGEKAVLPAALLKE